MTTKQLIQWLTPNTSGDEIVIIDEELIAKIKTPRHCFAVVTLVSFGFAEEEIVFQSSTLDEAIAKTEQMETWHGENRYDRPMVKVVKAVCLDT